MDAVTIAVYLIGLVGAGLAGVPLYRAYRMKRAGDEPVSDDACAACNSPDLTVLAARVYRCNRCGFEAGSGMPAHQAELAARRIEAMSGRERLESAVGNLSDARLALLNAKGLLDNAARLGVGDLAGLGLGDTKGSVVVSAVSELRRAKLRFDEAAAKLRTSEVAPEIDLNSAILALDTSWFADGIVIDVAAQVQISQLGTAAERMLVTVDRALAQFQPSMSKGTVPSAVYRGP